MVGFGKVSTTGTVPKNQAVVWGSNLESFDSRYWGFIEYRQLKTMLLLL
jgi:type IV secretory pathway protease TraF